MDEQNSTESATLIDLIERVLHGTASEEQQRELEARLLANAEDRRAYLHYLNLHSALKRRFAFDGEEELLTDLGDEQASRTALRGTTSRPVVWSLATVAAAAVVVAAAVYFRPLNEEQPIAEITGLSGSLEWTGDGGRVFGDLSVGTELPGGTIEGMTPSSWFELEFLDGSSVTISGNSTLTFSDYGQKKLHLKAGKLSANVMPQPASKPMLIYTRSAMLEVVGTQFEVQTGLATTMLNVNQGTVRITRLSDDKEVEVHASQRVVAGAGRDMSPVPVPDSLNHWKSQLHLGPVRGFGEWSPGYDGQGATLRAVPHTLQRGATIYVASLDVSLGDNAPVVLQADSQFRIRGHIASPHEVYFGVTVSRPNGEFAGKFQTIRRASEFATEKDFEVVLPLRDFRLDPSLAEIEHKLPGAPVDLVVESIWCHTLYEPAGLEISEIELLASEESASSKALAGAASAGVDIWTAAAQGNLGVIRGYLAARGDIDAILNAPGTLASGATPLHLAVLTDQRPVVEFLSENGADLGARAKDEHGGTPLHWAAALGRLETAKLLVGIGADVNAPDDHGYTPLDATGYAPDYEREAKAKIADYLRGLGGLTSEEIRTRSTSH